MGNMREWQKSIQRTKAKRDEKIKEFLYDVEREKDFDKILVLVEDLYIEMLEHDAISLNKLNTYLKKYNRTIT